MITKTAYCERAKTNIPRYCLPFSNFYCNTHTHTHIINWLLICCDFLHTDTDVLINRCHVPLITCVKAPVAHCPCSSVSQHR